jgi:hypothetical protein
MGGKERWRANFEETCRVYGFDPADVEEFRFWPLDHGHDGAVFLVKLKGGGARKHISPDPTFWPGLLAATGIESVGIDPRRVKWVRIDSEQAEYHLDQTP